MSQYWWAGSLDRKGMHWQSWDKMAIPKNKGGLGFRDLQIFNDAMLAKQAWRLLITPESLCAQVLKARYFQNTEFLHASCPKNSSFTWKSILFGRELLQCGLVWRIGDGRPVDEWTDAWIPRAGSCRPLGELDKTNIATVADLLDYSGRAWDVQTLERVMLPVDISYVLNVTVVCNGCADYPA